MNIGKIDTRLHILIGVLFVIFIVYLLQLFKIQIIDHAKYVSLADISGTRRQIVKAARGEIVDRNGIVIVSNKNGYDIVINKALINKSNEYESILSIAKLLKDCNIQWADYLPMHIEQNKMCFDENKKLEIESLTEFLKNPKNSSSQEVWKKIIEKYKLDKYKIQEARIIAGIKYSMYLKGYSMSVPYIMAKNISMDELVYLKENSYKTKGLEIIENSSREYVLDNLAPHIIGTVGPIYKEEYELLQKDGYKMNDVIGKNGIEKYCEKDLKGTDGERMVYIDNDGKVEAVHDNILPIPGDTIKLTIDYNLQQKAQDALAKQIKHLNESAPPGKGKEANAGAVVVLDVQTGEIIAIASYPSYNINEYNKNFSELISNPNRPLFDRPLQGKYSQGSCLKPGVAVAALQEGIATDTSTVHCGRIYNFFSGYKPTCLGYHGNINVLNALKWSCNIYFYEVGRLLGINKIDSYISQFGFGNPTGVQLPENIGQRASPELSKAKGRKWYPGDVIQAAIGQLDNLASPLQLANYVATIANRGKRMEVSIIKEIKSYGSNNIKYSHKPKIIDKVKARREVFETVIEGMARASRSGTARASFGKFSITVPSKTGTPETSNLCNSTFVCFAPEQDSKIAIAVVIENGWHGYTGAPVAKEIIKNYFNINY